MAIPLNKAAPTAVVAGVLGYCCWSSLSTSEPKGGALEETRVAGIAVSLLSPPIAPPPVRNPFRSGERSTAQAAAAPVARASDRPAPAPTAGAGPREAPIGLDLTATFIRGEDRVAMINGRLYGPGDTLGPSGADAAVIAAIYPNKVLLRRQGQPVELTYSNAVRASGHAAGRTTRAPSPRPSPPEPAQEQGPRGGTPQANQPETNDPEANDHD
jgi:hypothetical protein